MVNLGEEKTFDEFIIEWERANVKTFEIYVSNDDANWTEAAEEAVMSPEPISGWKKVYEDTDAEYVEETTRIKLDTKETAKYVKLKVTGNDDILAAGYFNVSILEFQIIGDKTKNVTLKVGETVTIRDEDGIYAAAYPATNDVAEVTVNGTSTYDSSKVVTSVRDGRRYWIWSNRAGRLMKQETHESGGFELDGTWGDTETLYNYLWTIEIDGSNTYVKNSNGDYLHIGVDSDGNVGDGKACVKAEKPEGFSIVYVADTSAGWRLSQTHNNETYYLNHHGVNQDVATYSRAAGWKGTPVYPAPTDAGSQWSLYADEFYTDITFKGVQLGTTSVQVGDTLYNIQVTTEKVEDVKLYVGETKVLVDETTDSVELEGNLNTEIAQVAVETVVTDAAQVTEIVSGQKYWIDNYRKANAGKVNTILTSTDSSGKLALSGELATKTADSLWTIEQNDDGTYYIYDKNNQYLKITSGGASVTNKDNAVKTNLALWVDVQFNQNKEDKTWAVAQWFIYQGSSYLNQYWGGDNTVAAGDNKNSLSAAKSDIGNYWNIYQGPRSQMTFTGQAAGKTLVVVGDTTYNITVLPALEKTVELTVGEIKTLRDETNAYNEGTIEKESVANMVVTDVPEVVSTSVSQTQTGTLTDGASYLISINHADNNNAITTTEAHHDAGSINWEGYHLEAQAHNWTATEQNTWTLEKVGSGYKLKSAAGYFALGTNTNRAAVSEVGDVLYFEAADGNTWAIRNDISKWNSSNNIYINDLGGKQVHVGGWTGNGTKLRLYEVTKTVESPAYTEVAFEGLAVGTTTARVGNTVYHITVKGVETKLDDIVIDFGVPVTVPVNATITKCETSSGNTVTVSDGNTVTYTPESVLQEVDHVTLSDAEGNTYVFDVYPATSVYYDASFADYSEKWNVSESATPNQTVSIVGSGDNYGYEAGFTNPYTATSVTVGDSASLAFTGKGIDIYANSKENSGMILAQVKTDGAVEKMVLMDTKVNVVGKDENLSSLTSVNNIPVVCMNDLTAGEHTLTVNHVKKNTAASTAGVVLAGFRVYETLGEEAAEVYKADGEYAPVFVNMRDKLLALSVDDAAQTASAEAGVEVIIGEASVFAGKTEEYIKANSSKNEIYLYPGQALVFSVNDAENIQLGLRALTSTAVAVEGIAQGTVASNVDMFYKVNANNGTVTITNTSTETSAILAVTKLKVSSSGTAANVVTFNALSPENRAMALASLNYDTNEPTDELVTDVFADVAEGEWYVDAVQYVYNADLMTGNGNLFNPTKDVTRAQVVTTLYRMAGRPEVTDYKVCEELGDVAADDWYTDAVAWAYNTGITTGNTTTKMFNVDSPVTRQQLACFMYRYAEHFGMDVTASADLSGMLNADQVASYAQTAMKWAVAEGIISGSETIVDGTTVYDLKPEATASRAQMAKMLMNFDCTFNK